MRLDLILSLLPAKVCLALFLSAIVFFRDFPGDHGEEVTPVPIPNTEVKGLSGNGSVAFGHVRVARCRDFF